MVYFWLFSHNFQLYFATCCVSLHFDNIRTLLTIFIFFYKIKYKFFIQHLYVVLITYCMVYWSVVGFHWMYCYAYSTAVSRPDWQLEAECSQPVRPSICYRTCECDVLKTNEPILIQIATCGSRVKGMKQSTLGFRRSKFKVTRGQR